MSPAKPQPRGVDIRPKAGHDEGERLVLTATPWHPLPMRGGHVYIVTNRPNGTLYLGVTSDLGRRIWQHRTGAVDGFTKRYGLTRLVWVEPHFDIRDTIQRERTTKHWSRACEVRLILDRDPDWRDLTEDLNA